jgi:hypothetical protein
MSPKSKKRQPLQQRLQAKLKIPMNLGIGFPEQVTMTHKYVDEFTLTSALGVMANYRFRATGMFDPNHTAAGHQPAYFDTMSSIYDNWVVQSSVIDLLFVPTSALSAPMAIGVALNDDVTTIPTTFVQYEESSHVNVNYIPIQDASPRRLRVTYRSKNVFPFPVGGEWGSATADPGVEVIFNAFLQAVDQVSSVACFCVAKVSYTAVWFELKDLTTS